MTNRLNDRVRIPGTDLDIPFATIGTMMFGGRADEEESRRIVQTALDRGLNFFDTADMYSSGESERILGRMLLGCRSKCIVATKVGYGKNADGEEEGIGKLAVTLGIDASLKRLGMDYVDIYYLHRPDTVAPIEETLAAIQEVIKAGKARHFAISNFGAWQTYQVLQVCDKNGWQRPVMSQMIYNLLVRQIEYEYVELCRNEKLHLTVYNPLAGGLLTGKYASMDDENAGGRFVDNDMYRKRYWSPRMFEGMIGIKRIADNLKISLTHLATAWVAQNGVADSVLLGPSTADQLLDSLAAGEVAIPDESMAAIDEFLKDFDGTDATYAR